ncbi:MAG: Amuc_1100 family pilus-like protein [Verrucomicrobiota bacterium]|nr:Amuc_1100 family pilus-like protein [Verrucomicrobiota bacterium]
MKRLAIFGGGALLLALVLLWWTHSNFENASAQYADSATEQRRLESGNPYSSDANVRKLKSQLATYHSALDKLKAELKTRVLPEMPMAPNEFQTRLNQAKIAVADAARVQRVKLPENFVLGFDEYAAALPSTEEAPRLGRELAQVQRLVTLIIEARVDAITMFHRVGSVAVPTALNAKPGATPPKKVEHRAVEFTIAASPSVARKVVNQISAANEQFFIIRTLYVKNEKEKGPAREIASANSPAVPTPALPAKAGAPAASPASVLKFIVGEEHIDLSAQVELADFSM